FAKGEAGRGGGSGADGGIAAEARGTHGPVGRPLQFTPLGGGARVEVVGEHHAVADEHAVLDNDAFADEGMARYLAVLANTGVLLDFHEAADATVPADRAAVEIDEVGLEDHHALTHRHLLHHGLALLPAAVRRCWTKI